MPNFLSKKCTNIKALLAIFTISARLLKQNRSFYLSVINFTGVNRLYAHYQIILDFERF